jgi:hypothetical protein
MSTRSQLRFVQRIEYENEDGETESTRRVAQVYRHSDGYPESVLPSLAQLKALQDETGTERDPAYVAANYIFLKKLQGMGLYVGRDGGFGGSLNAEDVMAAIEENDVSGIAALEQPHFLLGYGVEDPESGIHGDEEYLYVVELPSRSPFEDSGEWSVKVSVHNGFPRWDGPTEDAFERAAWQYEGPLSAAIEELVAETV